MKNRIIAISLIAVLLLMGIPLTSCGFLGDPMLDDMWTRNIYPGTTNTYDVGSLAYQYQNGYFQNLFIGGVPVIPGGGGDVVGTPPSTDHAVARYDGITGLLIQNSLATVDDFGTIYTPADINTDSDVNAGNDVNITNDLDVTDDADIGGITTFADDIKILGDAIKAYFGASEDMTIWYDGVDGNIKTSDVGASDLNIITGAAKTIVLDTVVYDDIFIPTASARVPAANTPAWAVFTTNTKAYTFGINDYADLTAVEVSHSYKEGTDLEVHVHIVTNGSDVNERKAKYEVYYTWGDMNEVMGAEGTLTGELTIPAGTADMTHLYLDIGDVTGTNYKIGSLFNCRVKRIAGTGTEPSNDPFVMMVGVHYQIDTIGSRTETAK